MVDHLSSPRALREWLAERSLPSRQTALGDDELGRRGDCVTRSMSCFSSGPRTELLPARYYRRHRDD